MSAARYNLAPAQVKKREIKWIWKAAYENAFPEQQQQYTRPLIAHKPVLVLCNHCKNPPCVRVCPTQATWKREADGIVMMDMHRCIGCRYCVVGCPYGARSFNWMEPWPRPFEEHGTPPNMDYPTRTKGVVEKCTFCADLLAEAVRQGREDFTPACVAACPNGAMAFGNIYDEHSLVRRLLSQRHAIRRKPALGTEPQVYYLV
jgi:molybdopterin-containing oxidoreductase family iron-sulfur binding subunit